MKAVITVTGKDTVGIIADVSAVCSKYNANIVEITQTVLSEYFAMIMLVDISALNSEFASFVDVLASLGQSKNLDIHTMHEDIFNTMHHI
ncbi:MAG: ACT domain-containing protein [Clostridia bacterium]|nr:ACT domain-containing protein [Clostridia bacterium]MBR2927509.1 ACT domain-containing protein [Clostridia bacterium]